MRTGTSILGTYLVRAAFEASTLLQGQQTQHIAYSIRHGAIQEFRRK